VEDIKEEEKRYVEGFFPIGKERRARIANHVGERRSLCSLKKTTRGLVFRKLRKRGILLNDVDQGLHITRGKR